MGRIWNQADIFDHVLAVIPEFGLSVFKNVSGADLKNIIINAGSTTLRVFLETHVHIFRSGRVH